MITSVLRQPLLEGLAWLTHWFYLPLALAIPTPMMLVLIITIVVIVIIIMSSSIYKSLSCCWLFCFCSNSTSWLLKPGSSTQLKLSKSSGLGKMAIVLAGWISRQVHPLKWVVRNTRCTQNSTSSTSFGSTLSWWERLIPSPHVHIVQPLFLFPSAHIQP